MLYQDYLEVFIVKPYTKALTSHKLFTFIIQGFVVTKVEVIDISASAYRLVDPDFLLRCGIDFRLEAL